MNDDDTDIFEIDPVTIENLISSILSNAPKDNEMWEGWMKPDFGGPFFHADFFRRIEKLPSDFEGIQRNFRILLKNIFEVNKANHKRLLTLEKRIKQLEEENNELRRQ